MLKFILGLPLLLTVMASANCPSGFKPIGKLGCLQSEQAGTANCNEAILDCYKTYGGRLPSYSDVLPAIAIEGFPAEQRYEWVNSASLNTYTNSVGSSGTTWYDYVCGIIDTKRQRPLADPYYNKKISYRCFVPN